MFLRTVTIAILAILATILPATAEQIVLKSQSTGQYVGKNSQGLLVASKDMAGATRFEIITLNGSQVAFQADGQFLRAGVGANTNLMVASPHIRGWETFQKISARGTSVAFMSAQNGLYVSVGNDGAGTLAANADRITNSEMFQVLPVAIRLPRPPALDTNSIGFYQGSWSIVQIANENGNLVRPTRQAANALRFEINASGAVGYTLGCNSHSGQISLTAPRIRISDITGTKRLCQGFSGAMESRITEALQAARYFLGSSSQDIYFLDGNNREVLILRRN